MRPEMTFRVVAEGGRLVSEALRHFAATAKPGEYWFRVSEKRPSRTLAQNGYYWGAVVQIPAAHFGYTKDEMHETFKWMFLRRKERGKPDTAVSTSSLDVSEMTAYIEAIREWAAREYGIDIPDPKRWYESDIFSDEPKSMDQFNSPKDQACDGSCGGQCAACRRHDQESAESEMDARREN